MTPAMVKKLASLIPDVDLSETVFVFRPGAISPLASNVFNDWALLMAAVDAKQGLRTIEFDDSIVSPCVIPAGTWDMSGVTWSGTLNVFSPDIMVRVLEGAIFLKFRNISGAIALEFTGTTPPVSDFNTGEEAIIFIQGASTLECTGAGPFVRNSTPGATAIIAVYQYGKLLTGFTPAFDIADPGAIGRLTAFNVGNIQPNTVSSVVGSTLTKVIAASSAFIDQDQPAVLGNVADNNLSIQRLTPSGVVTAGIYFAQHNELVRCDLSTGGITVTLPSAINARGMWVVVKNIDPNPEADNITVVPLPGDTVDGNVAVMFNSPRQSNTYVSDGISDWLAI